MSRGDRRWGCATGRPVRLFRVERIDERRVTLEVLTSIKRAGADLILTYSATEAARWLSDVA